MVVHTDERTREDWVHGQSGVQTKTVSQKPPDLPIMCEALGSSLALQSKNKLRADVGRGFEPQSSLGAFLGPDPTPHQT